MPTPDLTMNVGFIFEVPEAQNRDKFGWLPLDIPSINPHPDGWKIYTDGSFDPHHPDGALQYMMLQTPMIAKSLFEIFGPVTIVPQDQRFFKGLNNPATTQGNLQRLPKPESGYATRQPGPTNTPAEIAYDSHYAANLTLGATEPPR